MSRVCAVSSGALRANGDAIVMWWILKRNFTFSLGFPPLSPARTLRMIIRPFWMLCAAAGVAGFHLPGGAPKDYARGDAVELLVNALDAQAGQGTSSLFS